jgi:hypothetical protein
MKVYNILNLGAGWQSSRILLGACKGEFPRFDAAVFADTQWEPEAVYENLAFLKTQAEVAGIPLAVETKGNLRADAIEFRRAPRSADGKRYASIPTFIKNLDGSQGRVKRQCTKEYKIEVVDLWIRRILLGLKPRQRIPKGILVQQWFGISDDEASRACFPGRYKAVQVKLSEGLYGDAVVRDGRKWMPVPWRQHCYPLLNEIWSPDRKIAAYPFLPRREQRFDCGAWLKRHYPERTFPRSACIGCPFRSNEEWRDMRDNRPKEWEDACDFDEAQRQADHDGLVRRGLLVGLSFVHRQLVPLRMANLEGPGEKGGGCGTLYDGQDGLCGI